MIDTKTNIKVSALGLFEELNKEKKRLIASKTILDKKDNHEYPITDIPFEIPSNWVWCYLSDISLIQEGPGIRKHQYATSGIQFLTVTNILEGSVDLEKSKKYISKEQYKNYSHFTINTGDIVTACSGGSWGKSAIYDLDEKLILNTSTLRLRFYNDLGDNIYLYYLTKTKYFRDSLSSYITGQQPNYGYSHYSKIPIPLPPLPEQQRIVAILNEVFAAIAKAKANAEQNLKNAKELFESYLQGVFEKKGDGWEERKLVEITSKIGSGATPRGGNESYKKEGISLIRSMNVHDFEFKERNLAFIDEQQAKELNNVTLQENDVLLNITGASVARCCVIPKEYLPARVNQHVSIIRAKKEIIDPIFLNLLLTSKFYKDQLLFTGEQGATRQAITKAQLEVFEVAFPKSVKAQQNIIQKLDALLSETKKLEAIYQQKINDLEELKKSVLQKAFAGELTSSASANVSLSKVIPLQKVEGISTTDLQAGITALALQKHIEKSQQHSFHHVKAEKIVHLSEYILNIDLERNPVKDAAGPNDFPHAKKVESRAKKAGFYTVFKNGEYYDYRQGRSIQSIIQKTQNCLNEKTGTLSQIIDILIPMNTQQAEIVATAYAAWNNLLLNNTQFTDDDIVTEARENWHTEKLKIPREKFINAIEWMKKNELLIPKGNGKTIIAK